jgi:hypothetical protein
MYKKKTVEKDGNTNTSEESLLMTTTLFLRFLEVLGLLKEPFNHDRKYKDKKHTQESSHSTARLPFYTTYKNQFNKKF